MDPIVLSAIKKAKEELALKLESGTSGTGSALAQLKASLEEKLSPWTGTRAAKLDRLDTTVSSRADGSYYTPGRASKLDKLDATVSSRADGKNWTAERAGKVDNLDARVSSRADGSYYTPARASKLDSLDKLDVSVSTRATQASVQDLRREVDSLKNRGTVKRVQRGILDYRSVRNGFDDGWDEHKGYNESQWPDDTFSKIITLPYPVDLNKSSLKIEATGSDKMTGVSSQFIDSQRIKIYAGNAQEKVFVWEVIEWY